MARTQHETRRGATIYSVADRAGVSIATVSRVLQGSPVVSDEPTRKVLDAVDRARLPAPPARPAAWPSATTTPTAWCFPS